MTADFQVLQLAALHCRSHGVGIIIWRTTRHGISMLGNRTFTTISCGRAIRSNCIRLVFLCFVHSSSHLCCQGNSKDTVFASDPLLLNPSMETGRRLGEKMY